MSKGLIDAMAMIAQSAAVSKLILILTSPYSRECLVPELVPQAVTLGNVDLLQLLEIPQQSTRTGSVMTIALKVGNDLPLPGNLSFTLSDEPFNRD